MGTTTIESNGLITLTTDDSYRYITANYNGLELPIYLKDTRSGGTGQISYLTYEDGKYEGAYGWIPVAADVSNGVGILISINNPITDYYTYTEGFPYKLPAYYIYTFSLESGQITGAYLDTGEFEDINKVLDRVDRGVSDQSEYDIIYWGAEENIENKLKAKFADILSPTTSSDSSGSGSSSSGSSSSNSSSSGSSSSDSSSSDSSTQIKVAEVNSSFVPDSNGFSSVNGSAPVTITSYTVGQETTLDSIKDYDGSLHAGDNLAATASSYKYQGMLDVNGDGVFETIFTNKSSKRWVTAKVDSTTGQIDFDDNGAGGGTRVVGIYADPLIAEGDKYGGFLSDGITPAPANFGVSDADRYVVVNGERIDRLALNSQVRFQKDLETDNLVAKHSGDYDSDGVHEVYWKTSDGSAYLRSLMHADGNVRYANYQSEDQMKEYLTANGDYSAINEII